MSAVRSEAITSGRFARRRVVFQAEYEGSIPFTVPKVSGTCQAVICSIGQEGCCSFGKMSVFCSRCPRSGTMRVARGH